MRLHHTRKGPPPIHDKMDVSPLVHAELTTHNLGMAVSRGYRIPEIYRRSDWVAWNDSRSHPRNVRYDAPAAARAVAMALERPGHVVCGMSALALYGLEYFVDGCDTTLTAKVRANCLGSQFTPAVFRRTNAPTWTVFYRGIELRSSPPHEAVVEAVQHIRKGIHTWEVTPTVDDDLPAVRAVQLVDACRRRLGCDPEELRRAGRGRINREWFDRVISRSSASAESPKETEMRLLCSEVCRRYGLRLAEQVVVARGGRIVTRFDLAIEELKIGLMYDGEDHLDRSRRDRDSRINLECSVQGWLVLRFTAGTLASISRFLEECVRERLRPVKNLGA